MNTYESFETAIIATKQEFLRRGKIVHSEQWQGVDISKRPEMAMHEVLHHSMQVSMPTQFLNHYRNQIKPNLPWADDHFEERVCGQPINPGVEWANWPYSKSADTFRDANGQFNHNYMERYWPRTAGSDHYIRQPDAQIMGRYRENPGIRGRLGDLSDVVNLLADQPLTRQAFLPVWFPEDTGNANPGRKPCTLGYHFMMRDNQLDVVYYIRSCDFVRHFRDDIYLTIRLVMWMLERLREHDPKWNDVGPGKFVMHITSLHFFRNDWPMIFPNVKPPSIR